MEHQIEVFTAECPVCEPVVALVKETICENCEITIHHLSQHNENTNSLIQMEKYGVKSLPAIAVDGKLIDCCKNTEITKDDLVNAGIGSR